VGGPSDPGVLPQLKDPVQEVIKDITRGIPEPYRSQVREQLREELKRQQEAAAKKAAEQRAAAAKKAAEEKEAAAKRAAEERAAAAAAATEGAEAQAQAVKDALAMEVYELDKVFPKDPDVLRYELLNGEPMEYRAKMLELALMRGGSYPYGVLMAGQTYHEGTDAKMAYQKMAVDAVLGPGGDQLFAQISKSYDAPPNTDRVPATQLMYMMLQEKGLKGDNDGQVEVKRWIESLDPETRGRAMYHVVDAAATREFGATGQLTGIDTPLGGGQWQYGDDGWKSTVKYLESPIVGQLNAATEAEKEAFKSGWNKASNSLVDVVGKGGKVD
jgi:hypothetical protein